MSNSYILVVFCMFFLIVVGGVLIPYFPEEIHLILILCLVAMLFLWFLLLTIYPIVVHHINQIKGVYIKGYGYYENKKIDLKHVPFFRGIPCNKDIYYAYMLIKLNKFKCKKVNILGAVILKWLNDNKISLKKINNCSKDKYVIELNMNPVFNMDFEIKLYELLYSASVDGILEPKELSKYVKKNYTYFQMIFKDMMAEMLSRMKNIGYIYENVKGCKYYNVMGNNIYNDSIQLYGLKKYLEEFSKMDIKEIKEVKLWNEYLIFACLFGISDKITKQFKKIDPEILNNDIDDFDYIPIGFNIVDSLYDISITFADNIDRNN